MADGLVIAVSVLLRICGLKPVFSVVLGLMIGLTGIGVMVVYSRKQKNGALYGILPHWNHNQLPEVHFTFPDVHFKRLYHMHGLYPEM
ncbi:MAG: hypothetical protein HC906_09665 [Bacteroidales bacterium]|nr:hypothetical protein [Bacteroidales bacterium]